MPSNEIVSKPQEESSKSIGLKLFLRGQLKLAYLFSLIIALLTLTASVAGIMYPEELYPTAELQESSVPNDVVTLFIGLPILLVSMLLAWRGSLLGLLLWPGAVFYGLYNYFIYLFGLPLTAMYLVYLAIVTLSIYTVIGIAANIKNDPVKVLLEDKVSERFSGGVLIALGVLFTLLAVSSIMNGVTTDAQVSRHELGLASADVFLSAAWIIGGVMLWRRQAFGYVSGTGLYFQGSMLFVGLILFLVLQPILTEAEFSGIDLAITAAMGLICFFPFGVFVRAIVQSR